MRVELLIAAMNQKDMSLYRSLAVDCDTVIANQCGEWRMESEGKCRMLSSDTVGVGVNRNLALDIAAGDIIVFGDDDMTYYDRDLGGVIRAFEKHPDADVILFGLDYTKDGEIVEKRRCSEKRRHLWNSLGFGACRTAIRRDAIVKNDLKFSTLFGGGCIYGSGEDTLFTRTCFKKGLRVYSDGYVLGKCAKDGSTWFNGFNEKYVFDKGAWLAAAFPGFKHLIKYYFARKFSKLAKFSYRKTVKLLTAGIRAYNSPDGCRAYNDMIE